MASSPSRPRARRAPPQLGTNTFSGASAAGGLHDAFFAKLPPSGTEAVCEARELLQVASPVSGNVLTLPQRGRCAAVRDPISGSTLRLSGSAALVCTPVSRQTQVHARSFYLTRDTDIAIAQLRATRGVNRHTNEKVGTAGKATGMDASLTSGCGLRCLLAKQQQQQQQQQNSTQWQMRQPEAAAELTPGPAEAEAGGAADALATEPEVPEATAAQEDMAEPRAQPNLPAPEPDQGQPGVQQQESGGAPPAASQEHSTSSSPQESAQQGEREDSPAEPAGQDTDGRPAKEAEGQAQQQVA